MNNNYNVVGIRADGIDKIKVAISEYITAIQKGTNIEATAKEIQAAIKGTNVEAQVATLANNVNAKVKETVGYLDAFSKKLDTIKSNYSSYDNSTAAIKNAANKLKS